jgi:hypothetical protein
MWILILIAVNVNDARDVPGRAELRFDDHASCERALSTMTYQLKTRRFRIQGKCQHAQENDTDRNR